MTERFAAEIRAALARGAPLSDLVDVLRTYRDQGMSQSMACDALEQVRGSVGEDDEDRVLDVMDIATGFCRAELRVWRDEDG